MVLIKGLNKTCLIDFQPYTSCVVFLGGCNFRCGYCHNPDLVLHFNNIPTISEDEFFSFLDSRKKWLDGVVISGGEPTIHKDLVSFIAKIKEKGYLVKLDTNGSNPAVISELIDKKLVDYIATDIKTSLGDYNNVCGVDVDIKKIRESIEIIKNSSVDHEFRTTFIPGIVTRENAIKIGETLKGTRKYVIQNFREKADMIEARFKNLKPYSKEELEEIKKAVKDCFGEVKIR
jgi:pyruvate formate lyase activating enzyme